MVFRVISSTGRLPVLKAVPDFDCKNISAI